MRLESRAKFFPKLPSAFTKQHLGNEAVRTIIVGNNTLENRTGTFAVNGKEMFPTRVQDGQLVVDFEILDEQGNVY